MYHTILCQSFHAAHYAMKDFFPTDDEGCEDAAELPQITKENEQLKKETKSEYTRAVQHVSFLNCNHLSSSESTADPDKNSVVRNFCSTVIAWYRANVQYKNLLNYYHTALN